MYQLSKVWGRWHKLQRRSPSIFRSEYGLGYFDCEEAAARKYDEAPALLGRQVDVPPALVMARAGASTPLRKADLPILK
jgi:hypothetical protein